MPIKTLEIARGSVTLSSLPPGSHKSWMHQPAFVLYKTPRSHQYSMNSHGRSWGSYSMQQCNCFLTTHPFTKRQHPLFVVLSKHSSQRIHMQKRTCAQLGEVLSGVSETLVDLPLLFHAAPLQDKLVSTNNTETWSVLFFFFFLICIHEGTVCSLSSWLHKHLPYCWVQFWIVFLIAVPLLKFVNKLNCE